MRKVLLDSCGVLTSPRSRTAQDSDLNLDLSEGATGRLCAAHSCAVWWNRLLQAVSWQSAPLARSGGAGRETCVLVCYDCCYWVSDLHRSHPSLQAPQRPGPCTRSWEVVWGRVLGLAAYEPAQFIRNPWAEREMGLITILQVKDIFCYWVAISLLAKWIKSFLKPQENPEISNQTICKTNKKQQKNWSAHPRVLANRMKCSLELKIIHIIYSLGIH